MNDFQSASEKLSYREIDVYIALMVPENQCIYDLVEMSNFRFSRMVEVEPELKKRWPMQVSNLRPSRY